MTPKNYKMRVINKNLFNRSGQNLESFSWVLGLLAREASHTHLVDFTVDTSRILAFCPFWEKYLA